MAGSYTIDKKSQFNSGFDVGCKQIKDKNVFWSKSNFTANILGDNKNHT